MRHRELAIRAVIHTMWGVLSFVLSFATIMVVAMILSVLEAVLEERENKWLHDGFAFGLAVFSTPFYLLWGWRATLTVLTIVTVWALVPALRERARLRRRRAKPVGSG